MNYFARRLAIPLVLTVVGVVGSFVGIHRYTSTGSVPDLHSRGLVVIDTNAGEREWTVRTEVRVSREGGTSLVISAFAPRVSGTWSPFAVPVTAYFVGEGMAEVSCKSLDVDAVKYSKTPENVQRAIHADINAEGPASALAQSSEYLSQLADAAEESSDPQDLAKNFAKFADDHLPIASTTLTLWAEEHKSWHRAHQISTQDGHDFIWAQECVLPEGTVWATQSEESWPRSTLASFLPPQVNVIMSKSEHRTPSADEELKRLSSYVYLQRVDRQELVTSYPPTDPTIYSWNYLAESNSFGSGDSRVDYAVPPSFVFEHAGYSDRRGVELTLIGAAIGLAVSAFTVFLTSLIPDRGHCSNQRHLGLEAQIPRSGAARPRSPARPGSNRRVRTRRGRRL